VGLMEFQYHFAMPEHKTFKIKPINNFLNKICNTNNKVIIDPFSNRIHGFATYYNDINPDYKVGFNLDAMDFIKKYPDESVDGVLFDPPYSLRQLKECYHGIGKALTSYDTTSYFHDIKDEIFRVLKPGGFVISFGWNSNGMSKKSRFTKKELMLIHHGGVHNDTIVLHEIKTQSRLRGVD
jgi:tRNA1(Val) A37 N6-methylase TrmN6